MFVKKLLFTGKAVIKAKLFHKRVPLVVSWSITHRCNYQCRYCGWWHAKDRELELTTQQILDIIDQLATAGTQRITFTGGEPLLREDIGRIIEYCRGKNIIVSINTNGSLIKKLSTRIDCLNSINLSLDGPEKINDSIRGRGSFKDAMQAIEFAKKNSITTELTAVISKMNINTVEYLLDLAKELDVVITFQPATQNVLGENGNNPIAPSVQDYKKVISLLMKEKKTNNKNIGNSLTGLKYLCNYPKPLPVYCARGLISCRIGIQGEVKVCDRYPNKESYNILELGFDEAWHNIKPSVCKIGCYCAKVVESNHLLSLDLDVIKNLLRLYWREHKVYRARRGFY